MRLATYSRALRTTTVASLILSAAGAATIAAVSAAPQPAVDGQGRLIAPARTEIAYHNSVTGQHWSTSNEHEQRPALSLIKLLIADYVYEHGTDADKAAATEMIKSSNDRIASQLFAKYPDSIRDRARRHELRNTISGSHWGNSRTTAADMVKFLEDKKRTDPRSPMLEAMKHTYATAADGYRQQGGTASLPDVQATKFGWSDNRVSETATASYGPDFTVVAITYGNQDQHSDDVRGAFRPAAPAAPKPAPAPAPAVPAIPALPERPGNPVGPIVQLPPLPELPPELAKGLDALNQLFKK